jgi:hypothetical protein
VIAGAQVVTNPAIPPNTVCSYLSSPPTLTNGQASWLRCDATGQLITTSSGGGGGGAVTIADGADVAEGAVADAAATQGGTGTVSAKLRLMTSQLNTIATTGTPVTGNVTVVQPTAASLNATVVGTGTFAVQATTQGAVNITLTDCSGTIATGATAQNAFTANAGRHGFTIANIDTTEPLWISFTTTAAASGTGSYPLAPADATTFANLSSFTSPPGMGINTALSVVAATTSHKFTCTVW